MAVEISLITELCLLKLSPITREPAFCICENKGVDQLRGNQATYKHLVFITLKIQSLHFLKP